MSWASSTLQVSMLTTVYPIFAMETRLFCEQWEKIESGRCCFYNLTNAGRKYLKDVRPDIDEEWDVDPDSFSVAAWKIIREKEQEETFPLYANYRRKPDIDRLDKKWTDEKNFMRMFSDAGECL